jgi:AcrR family transcriptional regulator
MKLIEEKDFNSIVVNDICDKAMVHRTTFYNHYQDKYDLLNAGMQSMYEELVSGTTPPYEIMENFTPDNPPAFFVQLFQHIIDNKAFYSAILISDGVYIFQTRMKEYLIGKTLKKINDVLKETKKPLAIPAGLAAEYNAGAIVSALSWWAKNGFAPTPLEMARYIMKLIGYGSFSIFRN